RETHLGQLVPPGRDAGDAVAGAALDALGQGPGIAHADRVERERGGHATPCTARSWRIRAAAISGSRSSPALSARRNSVA
ncbi:MAG: hypothetical protein ACK56I_05825, partial [bacterium]